MKVFILILLCYCMQVHAQTLTCQVNGGVVPCPPVVYPGANVTLTATVLAAVGSILWVLPTGTCTAHGSTLPDSILLSQTAGACKGLTRTCGPYTASNADPGSASNPCLISTLTLTATSSMTSSVIHVGTRSVSGQNVIVNTTQITVIVHAQNFTVQIGPPHVVCSVTSTLTVWFVTNIWFLPSGTSSGSKTPDIIVETQTSISSIGYKKTCGPYYMYVYYGNASIPWLTGTANSTENVLVQSLTCQVNGGVVSCPPVVCPGDQVTFTATVAAFANNVWLLPPGTCSGSTPPDSIALPQTPGACAGRTMTCGPYTATNADPGNASFPCVISTLTVTATTSMTSLVIKVWTQDVLGNTAIVYTTLIMVEAPPGPPNVMAQTIGPDMVQVVMNPSSNGGLPTSYNVTISNSSYTISLVVMANGFAMVNLPGLRNVSTYNISVVAINCAGNSSTQSYISYTTQPPSPVIKSIFGGVVGSIVVDTVVLLILVVVVNRKIKNDNKTVTVLLTKRGKNENV